MRDTRHNTKRTFPAVESDEEGVEVGPAPADVEAMVDSPLTPAEGKFIAAKKHDVLPDTLCLVRSMGNIPKDPDS